VPDDGSPASDMAFLGTLQALPFAIMRPGATPITVISVNTTDETRSGWYISRLAFVTTEFDLAETFASIATGSAPGSDKRLRNERNARTAYESAIHFLSRTGWSSTDAERLAAKKQQVEDLLRQLTAEPHC
jgi:hypothetical protein